jgi:hypothetical protein
MLTPSEINHLEIVKIREIERNETWLAGERLGHAVDPKSSEVQSRVLEIVLNLAPSWREEFEPEKPVP